MDKGISFFWKTLPVSGYSRIFYIGNSNSFNAQQWTHLPFISLLDFNLSFLICSANKFYILS